MNVDAFSDDRQDSWDELDGLVRAARGRPANLGASGIRRLGTLYRAAVADLATGRRRFPREPEVVRLEERVLRSRALLYSATSSRQSFRSFFGRRYWQIVRERPRLLLLSTVLLFAPAVVGTVWGIHDHAAAARVVPEAAEGIGHDHRDTDLGLPADQRSALASEIMTNNIQVTFAAFAGGVLLGLGTALALLYNGLLIGVVAGIAAQAGNTGAFIELVVPHGVLELSCIVVAGVAGLRLGWAIVAPGRGRRGPKVTAEARTAVALTVGTAPWLVLAGLTEGFLTPTGMGVGPALAVGFGLGAVFWSLVVWRGASDERAGLEPEVGGNAGRAQRARVGLDHDDPRITQLARHH
jgi:uncharacterized membrane protein SpoIIM required for sporulation